MGAPPGMNQYIQHPACARDTQRWLDRIANGPERARALQLLTAVGGPLEEAAEQQARPAANSNNAPWASTGKGWTHSATARATGGSARLAATSNSAQAWEEQQQQQQAVQPASAYLRPATASAERAPSGPGAALGGGVERVGTAAPRDGGPQQQQQSWGAPPAQVLQQIAASAMGGNGRAPTASVAASGGGTPVDPNDLATTYQLAFHLAQMYPDLYKQAMAATAAKTCPNLNFTSDWGDATAKAGDGAWAARFLRSVYTITNEEVHPDQGPASARQGAQPPGEAGFFRWLSRQQTYYRGLLKNGLLPGVDAKLMTPVGGEAPRGQHSTLETLRQMNAVARPEQWMSHSQAVHHPMRTCEDPGLTALVKERTRLRTMGFPPPQIEGTYPTVESKMRALQQQQEQQEQEQQQQQQGGGESAIGKVDIVFSKAGREARGRGVRPFTASVSNPGSRRPSSSSGPRGGMLPPGARPASASAALPSHQQVEQVVALGATSARPTGPKLTGPPPRQEKETFKSQLPIKWAAAAATQPSSTYTEAFGSLAGGASRKLASAGTSRAIRYREVTCPIGAVNPVTAMVPPRPAYPVPECYTTTKPFPQGPGDATMATVYRGAFAARAPEDVLRSLHASLDIQAKSKAMSHKSTLPMGKNAMSMLDPAQWVSEHHEHYVPHQSDVAGDRERAENLKRLLGGPTASAGKLTASHPTARAPAAVPTALVTAS